MKKMILCGLAGAFVAQVWGMVSWMGLGWHMSDFRSFKDTTTISSSLKSEANGTGIYMIPNYDSEHGGDPEKRKAWDAKAASGPFAFMVVRPDGIETGMGKQMGLGFLLNFLLSMGLFWLLSKTSITCPKGKVYFAGVAGTLGAVYVHFSNWNWWKFPPAYCIVGVVDLLITWMLVGAAMVFLSGKLDGKTS